MGYHDRSPPDYIRTGMGVVNPLRELQRKLDKIKEIVNELGTDEHENAGVVSIEHIWQITDILDGLDDDEEDVK